MSFSLEAIRAFSTAASLGSLSAAARALGKSQSTVSEAIKRLEAEIGLQLYERESRRVHLTDAGRKLQAQASLLISASGRFQMAVDAIASGIETEICLGVSDTCNPRILLSEIEGFSQAFPSTQLQIISGSDEATVRLVESEGAAFGVVSSRTPCSAELVTYQLNIEETLSVFVSSKHPLAKAGTITAQELSQYNEIRIHVGASYLPHGRSENKDRNLCCTSYLAAIELALLGYGWLAIPSWVSGRYRSGLVEVNTVGWPKKDNPALIWLRDRSPGKAEQSLLSSILNTSLGSLYVEKVRMHGDR